MSAETSKGYRGARDLITQTLLPSSITDGWQFITDKD
jgi:hypothetical protein